METIRTNYQGIIFKDETATENEVLERALEWIKDKYCPVIKEPCLCSGCAFFVIGRPCVDKRIFRASCTYAGTRHLVELYGLPSDRKNDTEFEGYFNG